MSPIHSPRRIARALSRSLYPAFILFPSLAFPQSASHWLEPHAAAQGALPSEGPAAARLNPADLAEVHFLSAAYGRSATLSGKDGRTFLQFAAGAPGDALGLPLSLAAGFGYMATGSRIDGSDATYEEAEYDPAIAVRMPADTGSRWRVEAGLLFAIIEFNAFNAVRSRSSGADAGTSFSIGAGGAGRFGLGFAYHGLLSPRIRLPESGFYRVPGWMEQSFAWDSPAHRVRAQAAFYIDEPWDKAQGPAPERGIGFSGWELEAKPLAWLGVKGERTRLPGKSNLGLVLYLPREWVHCDMRMEINLGHGKYDPFALPIPFLATVLGWKGNDEGRGWLLGTSISAGI